MYYELKVVDKFHIPREVGGWLVCLRDVCILLQKKNVLKTVDLDQPFIEQ